tara:strand:+ start:1238 stop:1525 length:288 start_codon:yes stop_codon:yes gene_type:complete
MKYTKNTLTTARGFINDVRKDIENGFLEEADMQLDYINKMLGHCIREELDLDAQEIYYKGKMQGIDDLDRRLDNVFCNVQDQLQAGECNLSQQKV